MEDSDFSEKGVIRLYCSRAGAVAEVVEFLNTVNKAYESVSIYLHIEELLRKNLAGRGRGFFIEDELDLYFARGGLSSLLGQTYGQFDLEVGARLELRSTNFNSPGFWDFLGKINPLEIIRLMLNDANERRKDRDYRDYRENERLHLDNLLKKEELIERRIRNLQELGATRKQLSQVRSKLIHEPVDELIRYQERGLIEKVEFDHEEEEHR